MADMRLKLDHRAIGDLALRSDGVRRAVEAEGAKRAGILAGMVGADRVDTHMGGRSRARFTIRRLQSLRREAADGALSRALRG